MTAQLSVNMTADEADLFAKLTTLIAKTAESEAAFKRVTDSSGQAAQATKEAAAQAEAVARATANAAKEQDNFAAAGKRLSDQLIRANETLSESYERQQSQLKAAFDAGRLGATEYEKSLSLLKTRSDEMQAAQERAALETSEAHKAARKEAEAGIKLADQLIRASETVEDAYSRQAAQLKAAFDAGRLGAAEYEKSLAKLKESTDQLKATQARASLEATEGWQKANREAESGVAIIDRLKVANTSLIDKYRQMAREVTQAHLAGKVSAEEHRQAMDRLKAEYAEQAKGQNNVLGDGLGGMVTGAVKKWATVATAVAAVNTFIRQQNDEIERGTRLLEAREKGAQDLASVSATPQEAVERNMQVEELATKFGVNTEKAAATVFALDSANLIQDTIPTAENFATVRKFGRFAAIADPEQLAKVAGLVNKTTGLPPDQAANMVAAASEATRINQADIARELDAAMGGAIMFSEVQDRSALATQTAAITAKLGQTQGAPGTLVRSAFMKLVNQGRDLLPLEALERAARMDDAELKETFGDEQSIKIMVQSYRDSREEFESMAEMTARAVAETGTPQDYMMAKINAFEIANPNLVALREQRQAEAARNYSAQGAGSVAKANKAAFDQAVAEMRTDGTPLVFRAPIEAAMGATAYFADIFNIQLKGSKQSEFAVSQEQALRDQVTAAMMAPPGAQPLAGATPDANQQQNATLEVLNQIRDGIRQPVMPPLVTRPGDDR